MTISRLRIGLFILAYGFFATAVGIFGLIRVADSKRVLIAEARAQYKTALQESKAQLSSLIMAVANDRTLQSNLKWGLKNSVQKQLLSHLQVNQLDQLRIINTSCQIIAHARVGKVRAADCKKSDLGAGFSWQQNGSTPILTLTAPIASLHSSPVLLAQGQLALSPAWRRFHPGLDAIWKDLGLSFRAQLDPPEDQPSAVIMSSGISKSGIATATIITHDSIINTLPSYLSPFSKEDFTLPSLLVFASIMMFSLLQLLETRLRIRAEDKLNAIESWASTLSTTAKTSDDIPALSPKASLALKRIFDHTSHLTENARQQHQDFESKITQLQTYSKTKENEVHQLQREIEKLSEFESIAEQLKRASKRFLKITQEIVDRSHQIQQSLIVNINPPAEDLHNQILAWKQGTHQRGARKFFRSLSETEPEHKPRSGRGDSQSGFATLLDEQMDHILQLTQYIFASNKSTLSDATALRSQTETLLAISTYWHQSTARADCDDDTKDSNMTPNSKNNAIDLKSGSHTPIIAQNSRQRLSSNMSGTTDPRTNTCIANLANLPTRANGASAANDTHKNLPSPELIKVLAQTKTLTNLDPIAKKWEIVSGCKTSPRLSHAPQRIWAAAIYHIIAAISACQAATLANSDSEEDWQHSDHEHRGEQQQTQPLVSEKEIEQNNFQEEKILVHYRTQKQTCLLVITLSSASDTRVDFSQKEPKRQLDLANKLLAPYKVSCSPLLTSSGPNPIAIKWQEPRDAATNRAQSAQSTDTC